MIRAAGRRRGDWRGNDDWGLYDNLRRRCGNRSGRVFCRARRAAGAYDNGRRKTQCANCEALNAIHMGIPSYELDSLVLE